jgi:hypothetical protein
LVIFFKIGSIENAFLKEIRLGTGKEVEKLKLIILLKKMKVFIL